MNKKVIGIIVVAVVIIAVVVGIVLIKGSSGSGNTSGKGLELTYDFSHMNNKVYSVKLNLNSDDEITEFDKEEPDSAIIENKKDNYIIDLTLNTESVDKIYCDFGNDINKSSTFSFKIHKKRKGTVLERWLYYHNHKKKRIRKKYRIDKLLIRG